MRVYKTKTFARFQRREGLTDAALCAAVADAGAGLIDADLGRGLIKQRVARAGQGKRGGHRTVIAYRKRDRAVFRFGFAKNAKADLKPDEFLDLADIGGDWLKADAGEIRAAFAARELMEVDCGEEN